MITVARSDDFVWADGFFRRLSAQRGVAVAPDFEIRKTISHLWRVTKDGVDVGFLSAMQLQAHVFSVHWTFVLHGREALDAARAVIMDLVESFDAQTLIATFPRKTKTVLFATARLGFRWVRHFDVKGEEWNLSVLNF